MPRRFLLPIAAGVLCVLCGLGRVFGEAGEEGVDPLEGIDTNYQKNTGETFYSPWLDRWPLPDIDVYPIVVRTDSGTKDVLLRVALLNLEDRRTRAFRMTIDGESISLDLNESGKARVNSKGCRSISEVTLFHQDDLMRRIAAAAEIEAAYDARYGRITYRFVPADMERFRRMLTFYDRDDLPAPGDRFEGELDPNRPAVPQGTGATCPELIPASKVIPEYPAEALRRHLETRVVVGAQVLKDGSIRKIHIVKPAGGACGFEESALAAVRQWKYLPAKCNGEPVDVYFKIIVDFLFPQKDTPTRDIQSRYRHGRDPHDP